MSDIVVAKLEWVLEAAFELNRQDIHRIIYRLASHQQFCFEDWPALHCALMDYKTHPKVDLSDCLIARRAVSAGVETLYTFENNKKLGALPIVTSIQKSER